MQNVTLASNCSGLEDALYCRKPQSVVCTEPEYYGQIYGLVGSLFQSSILGSLKELNLFSLYRLFICDNLISDILLHLLRAEF